MSGVTLVERPEPVRSVHQGETVSICIPVYNGAQHLDAAIWSARRQTLSPLEIIVVDDGSTDGSVPVAEAHAIDDPRVRVEVNPANLGLTRNWQRAVDASRGRWIKFLFQDDLLDPTCIERLLQGVQESEAVMGFSGRRLLADGVTGRQLRALAPIERRNLGRLLPRSGFIDPTTVARLAVEYWAINVIGEPTSALIRRDVFEEFGTFDAALTQLCDWEYWVRVGVSRGFWFEVDPLATFRIHPTAATMGNRRDRETWTVFGETALIGWKFLCSSHYEPIRNAAAEMEPPVDLGERVARHLLRFDLRSKRSREGHAASLAEMERTCGALPDISLRAAVVERAWMRVPVWLRGPIKRIRNAGSAGRRRGWMHVDSA